MAYYILDGLNQLCNVVISIQPVVKFLHYYEINYLIFKEIIILIKGHVWGLPNMTFLKQDTFNTTKVRIISFLSCIK